jgi:hypothetical protein
MPEQKLDHRLCFFFLSKGAFIRALVVHNHGRMCHDTSHEVCRGKVERKRGGGKIKTTGQCNQGYVNLPKLLFTKRL